MGWFLFGPSKPKYHVLGYTLPDDVKLTNLSRRDRKLVTPGGGKVTILKHLLVNFSWKESRDATNYLADETRAFFERGQLDGTNERDNRTALARIACDLQSRQWPVERATKAMVTAAIGAGLSEKATKGLPGLVEWAYSEPRSCGRCTEPGRFRVVSASVCVKRGFRRLSSNAMTRMGEGILVPSGFLWASDLVAAVQKEIDDPQSSTWIVSTLEQQLQDKKRTVDLIHS
jgi:hypothetical protein